MSISFWKGNPHESGCIPMVCNKDFNLLPLRELDDKQDFYIRLSTLLAGFGDKEVSQLPFYLWLVTQNLTDLVATRLLSIRYNHKGHFWTWFFTAQHQPYKLNKIKIGGRCRSWTHLSCSSDRRINRDCQPSIKNILFHE